MQVCLVLKKVPSYWSVNGNEGHYKINFKDYKLMLINTNVKHDLSESAYNDRREVCEKVSELLNISALRDASKDDLERIKTGITDEDYQKALYVINENIRVKQFSEAIKKDDIDALGDLLYKSHFGLKNLYEVSCKELDFLVDFTIDYKEIIGSRMMGGGFGGCTINLIKEDFVEDFIKLVSKAYSNKFNIKLDAIHVNIDSGVTVKNN